MCYLCDLLRCLFERMDKYPLQLPVGTFILFFFFFFLLFTHLIFCVFKNKTVQWPESQESRRSSVQSPLTEGSSRDGVRGWRNGRTETGEGGSYYEIHPHHHHHLPPFFFFSGHFPLDVFSLFLLMQNIRRRRTRSIITARMPDGQTAGRTDWLISVIFNWKLKADLQGDEADWHSSEISSREAAAIP